MNFFNRTRARYLELAQTIRTVDATQPLKRLSATFAPLSLNGLRSNEHEWYPYYACPSSS